MPFSESCRNELIVEQYYILTSRFELNTILVVNNPLGSTGRLLHMYNRDKTVLYYSSDKEIDFIKTLNIHHTTFSRHLEKGTHYLSKYVFSREQVDGAVPVEMTINQVKAMLEKDRVWHNKTKGLGKMH